jgi:hypothetical protein
MIKRTLLCLLLLSPLAYADEDVLTLDRVVPNNFELAVPNDSNIQPSESDFRVINLALMSNEAGERWAVATIKNMSSGRRTLTQRDLMALTANGQRIHPREISQSFNGDETISLVVNFGEIKFPLLSVYTRND